jgi:aminocarboxymuconate-semialdehyde decarboxylase
LPFVLGRLKRNAEITSGLADPVDAIGRLYLDTILHDVRVLQFVIAMLGTDRLMMGSDSPFPIGDLEPMRIVAAAGLSAEQAAAVNGGIAAKLFGIR